MINKLNLKIQNPFQISYLEDAGIWSVPDDDHIYLKHIDSMDCKTKYFLHNGDTLKLEEVVKQKLDEVDRRNKGIWRGNCDE